MTDLSIHHSLLHLFFVPVLYHSHFPLAHFTLVACFSSVSLFHFIVLVFQPLALFFLLSTLTTRKQCPFSFLCCLCVCARVCSCVCVCVYLCVCVRAKLCMPVSLTVEKLTSQSTRQFDRRKKTDRLRNQLASRPVKQTNQSPKQSAMPTRERVDV